MEDEFFATVKLKSGEEIFAKVAASEEDDDLFLVISDPIMVTQNSSFGFLIEPWMKTTTQSMFIINLDDVITMSECNDIAMIKLYASYVRKSKSLKSGNQTYLTKEMGHLGNVNDMKEILERLYELDKTESPEQ